MFLLLDDESEKLQTHADSTHLIYLTDRTTQAVIMPSPMMGTEPRTAFCYLLVYALHHFDAAFDVKPRQTLAVNSNSNF